MFNKDRWQEIFETIKKNKLRTFLSGFTVALGIFIFIILFGLGNGLKNSFKEFFLDDATNIFYIESGKTSKPFKGYKASRRIEFENEDLKNFGAHIDATYFCPHHPDRGFKGENLKFKIDCNCRKPKLGLFELAMNELNIDKKKSWIIGDSYRDIEAGNRLGIKTIYLSKEPLQKTIDEIKPSFIEKNLYEGVRRILHNNN